MNLRLPSLVSGACALYAGAWVSFVGVAAEAPSTNSAATTSATAAAPTNKLPDKVDDAWNALMAAQRPPQPPAEWNQRPVTDDDRAKYKLTMGQAAATAADLAHEFAVRFPSDPRASMAKDYHIKLLQAAVNLGATDRKNELDTLMEKRGPETPENSVDAAFAAKFKPLFESIKPMMETNRMAGFRTYFEGLKGLQKEFPAHPQIYIGLSECASQFPPEEAKVILREIATNSLAMAQVREQAEATLQRLEMYGKSIEIQYKAVDGQDVDTVKLRGKVVLVDFWATWCGPCIRALPEVKAAYEKLHAKGFEVVAISLDEDKEALDRFLKKNEIPWPQYFDGKGWQNTFAKQYGIQAIPATWLLDKKGKLREMETRDGLEGKIEKLLAED